VYVTYCSCFLSIKKHPILFSGSVLFLRVFFLFFLLFGMFQFSVLIYFVSSEDPSVQCHLQILGIIKLACVLSKFDYPSNLFNLPSLDLYWQYCTISFLERVSKLTCLYFWFIIIEVLLDVIVDDLCFGCILPYVERFFLIN